MAKSYKKNQNLWGYFGIIALIVAVPITIYGVSISHQGQQNAAGITPPVPEQSLDGQSMPPQEDPMDFSQVQDSGTAQTVTMNKNNAPIYTYTANYDFYNQSQRYGYPPLNGNFTLFNFSFTNDEKHSTLKYYSLLENNNPNAPKRQCLPDPGVGGDWSARVTKEGHSYVNHQSEILYWCDVNFYYKGAFKYATYPRVRAFADGSWKGYQ